jgi:hypothetical protein
MILGHLKNIYAVSLRLFLTVAVCTLLFVVNVLPVAAASNPKSGEASLNEVQKEADQTAKGNPPGLKEVQTKASQGTNEVQGAANREKMISPDQAQNAETVEEQAKKGLKSLFN